jgi:hypothetical protein
MRSQQDVRLYQPNEWEITLMNTRAHKHVEVVIALDGTCTIDALNFMDASCTQVTRQLAEALGGQIVADRLKPEAAIRPQLANDRKEAAR